METGSSYSAGESSFSSAPPSSSRASDVKLDKDGLPKKKRKQVSPSHLFPVHSARLEQEPAAVVHSAFFLPRFVETSLKSSCAVGVRSFGSREDGDGVEADVVRVPQSL